MHLVSLYVLLSISLCSSAHIYSVVTREILPNWQGFAASWKDGTYKMETDSETTSDDDNDDEDHDYISKAKVDRKGKGVARKTYRNAKKTAGVPKSDFADDDNDLETSQGPIKNKKALDWVEVSDSSESDIEDTITLDNLLAMKRSGTSE